VPRITDISNLTRHIIKFLDVNAELCSWLYSLKTIPSYSLLGYYTAY
jgi:hypothetical protein